MSDWLLMAARLVIACSHGLFFGVAMIIAGQLVPKERQGSAISFVIAGITIASVLGVPIGTAIGNAYGWRATFWAISAVGVGATVALALLIPTTKVQEREHRPNLRAEIRAVGRQSVFLSYAIIALYMTAILAVLAYSVPMLTTVTGFSTAAIPWLLFAGGVGGIFGNFLGGRLGDWKIMPSVIAILILMLAIYLATLVAVYDPIAMTVTFFLMWLVGFSFPAPVQTRILRGASEAPNLASTLISTAFNIGIAGGAWLGGLALHAGWGYARLPLISALFMGAALAVALFSWTIEQRALTRGPAARPA